MPPVKYKNAHQEPAEGATATKEPAVPTANVHAFDQAPSATVKPVSAPTRLYTTRLIQTGMSLKDIERRMSNVFDELCPLGWRYHSTFMPNSSEAIMVFEMSKI
jgi:hypothetical protein